MIAVVSQTSEHISSHQGVGLVAWRWVSSPANSAWPSLITLSLTMDSLFMKNGLSVYETGVGGTT